jgi:hypothetical protein
MNKKELIKTIAEEAGITQREAKIAVEAVFNEIKESLETKEKVTIRDIGTLVNIEPLAAIGVIGSDRVKIITAKRTGSTRKQLIPTKKAGKKAKALSASSKNGDKTGGGGPGKSKGSKQHA